VELILGGGFLKLILWMMRVLLGNVVIWKMVTIQVLLMALFSTLLARFAVMSMVFRTVIHVSFIMLYRNRRNLQF